MSNEKEPNGKRFLSALKEFSDSLTEEEKKTMFKSLDEEEPNPFQESLKLLRDLADLQNGAPLEQHRKELEETMEQVYQFLNKWEDNHSTTTTTPR